MWPYCSGQAVNIHQMQYLMLAMVTSAERKNTRCDLGHKSSEAHRQRDNGGEWTRSKWQEMGRCEAFRYFNHTLAQKWEPVTNVLLFFFRSCLNGEMFSSSESTPGTTKWFRPYESERGDVIKQRRTERVGGLTVVSQRSMTPIVAFKTSARWITASWQHKFARVLEGTDKSRRPTCSLIPRWLFGNCMWLLGRWIMSKKRENVAVSHRKLIFPRGIDDSLTRLRELLSKK